MDDDVEIGGGNDLNALALARAARSAEQRDLTLQRVKAEDAGVPQILARAASLEGLRKWERRSQAREEGKAILAGGDKDAIYQWSRKPDNMDLFFGEFAQLRDTQRKAREASGEADRWAIFDPFRAVAAGVVEMTWREVGFTAFSDAPAIERAQTIVGWNEELDEWQAGYSDSYKQYTRKVGRAEGVLGTTFAALSSLQFVPKIIEQFTASSPSLVAGGLGALTGPLAPFAVPALAGAAGAQMEYGAWVMQAIREDPRTSGGRDVDGVAAALSDQAFMSRVKGEALRKGIVIGAAEAVGGRLAGRQLAGAMKASKAARAINAVTQTTTAKAPSLFAAGAKDFAVESFGEGFGEWLSVIAATGESDLKEAALEAVYGAGTSAGQIAIGQVWQRVQGNQKARALTEQVQAVADGLKDSSAWQGIPLSQRQEVARVLLAASEGEGKATVRVSRDVWEALDWGGRSPEQVAYQMGGDYIQSLQTGEVEVDLGAWVAEWAPRSDGAQAIENAMYGDSDRTLAEVKVAEEALLKDLEERAAAAEAAPVEDVEESDFEDALPLDERVDIDTADDADLTPERVSELARSAAEIEAELAALEGPRVTDDPGDAPALQQEAAEGPQEPAGGTQGEEATGVPREQFEGVREALRAARSGVALDPSNEVEAQAIAARASELRAMLARVEKTLERADLGTRMRAAIARLLVASGGARGEGGPVAATYMADLLVSFYETHADRFSTTLDELAKRFKLDIGTQGRTLTEPATLEQAQRARLEIHNAEAGMRRFVMAFTNRSNRSSFFHEAFHAFSLIHGDLVMESGSDAEQARYDELLRASGVPGDSLQERHAEVQHILEEIRSRAETGRRNPFYQDVDDKQLAKPLEWMARGGETYMIEGRSPSKRLVPVFAAASSWIASVYKRVVGGMAAEAGFEVNLSDEVRELFDTWFATDAEITAYDRELYTPILPSSKVFDDLSDDERRKMRETARHNDAAARDQRRRKVQAERHAAAETLRKADLAAMSARVAAVIRESLADTGIMKAYEALTASADEGGIRIVDIDAPGLEMLPAIRADVEGYGFMADESWTGETLTLTRVIQRFNDGSGSYPTGEIGFVEMLALAAEPEALVERMARDEIKRKTPELLRAVSSAAAKFHSVDDKGFSAATEKIMRLEARLDEARGRGRETKERLKDARTLKREAADKAKAQLGNMRVSDIRPDRYRAAAARQGRRAADFAATGNFEKAAAAAHQHLMNLAKLYEAQRILANANKAAAKIGKTLVPGRAAQKRLGRARNHATGKADGRVQKIYNGLAARFGFAKGRSSKLVLPDAGENAQAMAREWYAAGLERSEKSLDDIFVEGGLGPYALHGDRVESWRDLTADELADVVGSLEAVMGAVEADERLSEVVADMTAEELDAFVSAVVTRMRDAKDIPEKMRGSQALVERQMSLMGKYQGGKAALIKPMLMLQVLDGGEEFGPLQSLFFRVLTNATARTAEIMERWSAQMADALEGVPGYGTPHFSRRGGSANPRELTRENVYVLGALYGSETGRQRVRELLHTKDQEGASVAISDAEIMEHLNTLSAQEIESINEMQDAFESWWPEIEAHLRRVSGVVPEKIERLPTKLKNGTLRGGYFPLSYTGEGKAEQKTNEINKRRAMQGARGAAAPGLDKNRVEKMSADSGVQPKLRIDLALEHMREVAHDIGHREGIAFLARLLDRIAKDGDVSRRFGPETLFEIREGLNSVATNRVPGSDAVGFARLADFFSRNFSRAKLMLNPMVGLIQPLGILNSLPYIGPQWVAHGIAKMKNPAAGLRESWDKSPAQKSRWRSQHDIQQEMRERATDPALNPLTRKANKAMEEYGYFMPRLSQGYADGVVWHGAYGKAKAEGHNETRAIEIADMTVEKSQGSGDVFFRSRLHRSRGWVSLFTRFMFYPSLVYNQVASAKTKFVHSDRTATDAAKMTAAMLGFAVMPAIAETLMRALLRGDELPDDEDDLIEYIGKKALVESTRTVASAIPGAGTLVEAIGESLLFDEVGGGQPRVTTPVDGLVRSGARTFESIKSGDLPSTARNSARLISEAAGIPLERVYKMLEAVYDISEGDAALPRLREALLGKPQEL